jgi:hypothetical protein
MSDAGLQLALALRAALLADAGVGALVGGRVHDGPPRQAATPWLGVEDIVSEDRSGTDAVLEAHDVTLRAQSRAGGKREALAIAAAAADVAAALGHPAGHRLVLAHVTGIEARILRDRITAEATVRLSFLTEPT